MTAKITNLGYEFRIHGGGGSYYDEWDGELILSYLMELGLSATLRCCSGKIYFRFDSKEDELQFALQVTDKDIHDVLYDH